MPLSLDETNVYLMASFSRSSNPVRRERRCPAFHDPALPPEHKLLLHQVLTDVRCHTHSEGIPSLAPAGRITASLIESGAGNGSAQVFEVEECLSRYRNFCPTVIAGAETTVAATATGRLASLPAGFGS